MLVIGGRAAKVRVWSLLSAAGAVLAFSQAGCGSRTSMLDPDVYSTDGGSAANGGSSSKGGASKGGAPAIGGAISTTGGTPTTPAGGKTSLDPNAAVAPCSKYCDVFAPLCPNRLNGQECNSACVQEVNGFGKNCQTLGIRALQCLTPFFKPNTMGCEQLVGEALVKCGPTVDKFQKCKNPQGTPTPTPGVPQPQPEPDPPSVDPTTCPGMGTADPSSCFNAYSCESGTYVVACAALTDPPYRQSCSCTRPDGTSTYRVLAGSPFDACGQMVSYCNE